MNPSAETIFVSTTRAGTRWRFPSSYRPLIALRNWTKVRRTVVGTKVMRAAGSLIEVLVVDDYEPFRRFICSTIQKRPGMHVIGEASDGLDAVKKAQQLRPDLILLDIGLPKLHGIEAARRIRKSCPKSKMVFVTQEQSNALVGEALSTGALSYIVKTDVASELLAGVDAALRGELFISSKVAFHLFRTDASLFPKKSTDLGLSSIRFLKLL